MAAVFGNVGASAGEVNDFHSNSDVDKSTLAQHHTLGPQPNQASPGDHTHDGKTSKKLQLQNIQGISIDYTPEGGTTGTQPTFSGPALTGSYTKWGNMVHFQVHVDFDNIITFGTGQYYVTLPYPAQHAYQFRDGCLHDISANRQYTISGHIAAGTNTLYLFTTDRQGNRIFDLAFTYNDPVALASTDNFHVAGTYEIIE